MVSSKFIASVALGFSLLSFQTFAGVDSETEDTAKGMGANAVMEVSFDEGSAALTEDTKKELRNKISEAKQTNKIDELKIASWADREYPSKDTKASKSEVELAKKRGENLKSFVKDELKVGDVSTYNMTERPNPLQKFFRTGQAKVKNAMEASGAAPRTEKETGVFGTKAKASKAVIMIYYE